MELIETNSVFAFAEEWIKENPEGTLADYLDWLATYDIQKLKLMTIFAAKGLEWPCVIEEVREEDNMKSGGD